MLALRHLITTTRGGKLKPTAAPDEYKLKVYVGGGKNEGPAREKAIKKIEEFLPGSGYAYYTIIRSKYIWLPASAYEYTIQFRRA